MMHIPHEKHNCDRQKLNDKIFYLSGFLVLFISFSAILTAVNVHVNDSLSEKITQLNDLRSKQAEAQKMLMLWEGYEIDNSDQRANEYMEKINGKLADYNFTKYRMKEDLKRYFILPFFEPENCYVLNAEAEYGYRKYTIRGNNFHYGFDARMIMNGNIINMADGVVFATGFNADCGNYIQVYHSINGRDYMTVFYHLSKIDVIKDQAVQQGQVLGFVGMTGKYQTGVHLHFQLCRKSAGQWVSVNLFENSLYKAYDDREKKIYDFLVE